MTWIPRITIASCALTLGACATDPPAPPALEDQSAEAPAVPAEDARPNIVLVLFEDMSARAGAYGDPLAQTPNFDRIAAEGVLYTNAYTSSGVCAPSRAALMTGRHQMTIGAQHMRTHGYLGASGGGPQDYHAVPPAAVKAFPELLRAAGYHATNNWKTDYQFGAPSTIWDASEDGADWSGRADGQPFFHMRTLLTTHESFVWPVDMETTTPLEELVVARNQQLFANRPAMTDPSMVEVPPYLPDTPAVRRDIATHYDNIAFTDAQLGALYQELEESGLLDETILIVSTDHGDGLPRMKRSLYDSGLHVPFVVRYPDGSGAGTVEEELISFVDLGPTILSWAGIDAPAWMQGRDFAGADRDPPREYIFAAQDRMDTVMNHRRAVRDDRFKYIRNIRPDDPFFQPLAFRDAQPTMKELWAARDDEALPPAAEQLFAPLPEDQLYDTETDPHEINNLAGDAAYADVQTTLETALDQWLETVGDMATTPEADMIEAMWPGGEQPVTAAPRIRVEHDGNLRQITIESETPGASIGYRLSADGPWQVYADTLVLREDETLEAKAVRYGYAESAIVSLDD